MVVTNNRPAVVNKDHGVAGKQEVGSRQETEQVEERQVGQVQGQQKTETPPQDVVVHDAKPTAVDESAPQPTGFEKGLQTKASGDGHLVASAPVKTLKPGTPLRVEAGATLAQVLAKHYGGSVSSELVDFVRALNNLGKDQPLPDKITVWKPEALYLQYHSDRAAARAADAKTPSGMTADIVRGIEKQLGGYHVSVPRAGDTWSTFVDRELSGLALSSDEKAIVTALLKRVNLGPGLPPVVAVPKLEELARLVGNHFRQETQAVPATPPPEIAAAVIAAGCDPAKVSATPVFGQALQLQVTQNVMDAVAFADRERLLQLPPADAELELAIMTQVVYELNRGGRTPLYLPSAERMAAYVAEIKREKYDRTTPPTPAVDGAPAPSPAAHVLRFDLRRRAAQALDRLQGASAWPKLLSPEQLQTLQTGIANKIWTAARFEPASFTMTPEANANTGWRIPMAAPPGPEGAAAGSFELQLTPATSTAEAKGLFGRTLSLSAGGLCGPLYAAVPTLGCSWGDLKAARVFAEAMGQTDFTRQPGESVADYVMRMNPASAPEDLRQYLERAHRIQSIVTTLDKSGALKDGKLALQRNEGEGWYQAVVRLLPTLSAEERGIIANALEREHGGARLVSVDPVVLLGRTHEDSFRFAVGDPDMRRLMHDVDGKLDGTTPETTSILDIPTPTPSSSDDSYLAELKRKNPQLAKLSDAQMDEVKKSAKSFRKALDQIEQGRKDPEVARANRERAIKEFEMKLTELVAQPGAAPVSRPGMRRPAGAR
ncbi:MAG: hypothetical protein HY903_21070 [Deltaproteobacteria bacterium]|nr:hypothetical protein [Deltaproteobacteria bacterium]